MDILLPVKSQNGRIYTYKIKKYTASEVRMESGYNPITLSGKGGEIECLQQANSLPTSSLS